jgi:hypothetical protein
MQKRTILSFVIVIIGFFPIITSAQAVKEKNTVTVGVSLNQVLRLSLEGEDNIEFVFKDFSVGINKKNNSSLDLSKDGSQIFKTNITVSSSVRWTLYYGAEQSTFVGMNNHLNTLDLNNVGFTITNNGLNYFESPNKMKASTNGASLFSRPTNNGSEVSPLQVFPTPLIEDNLSNKANAGDEGDNSFIITWRCGTAEKGMNPIKLINQNPSPVSDKYLVNVIFQIGVN